jgi:hypothetical protein
MSVRIIDSLPTLFEQDETAWLEAMAELARDGRAEHLDLGHLSEYLLDMARRDRREVESRLAVLLSHLLKWDHQPDHRSRGWRATVIEQRQELERLLGSRVLRNHAQEVLADVYIEAVERAAAECGSSRDGFPVDCPYTLDQLVSVELPAADA